MEIRMTKGMRDAALAAEKRKLIADGEVHRVALVYAKVGLEQALRPEVLWQAALSQALGFAVRHVEHVLAPSGLRMQTVMPYLLAGLSLIARKKMIKPALGVGVLGALALAWVMRKNRR
jgi:hypothetical protein